MYPQTDSLGRKIASTQRLARKFNSAKGQLAMAQGCLKSLAHILSQDELLSVHSAQELRIAQIHLQELQKNLTIDYQLAKIRLRRKESEQSRQSDLQKSE